MSNFTDRSYPPIGTRLQYERGDGAVITLTVQSRAEATIVHPPQPLQLQMPTPQLNMRAPMETRGNKKATTAVATRPGISPVYGNDGVFDHAFVGGRFTVFVLLYGPDAYYPLHQRCLNSILGTLPKQRIDLRVGSNALNPTSLRLVEDYVQRGLITKHYRHPENAYKYPVMREMFHDPSCPITTKWVLWFDDDTIADVEPAWCNLLAQEIIRQHPRKVHMLGANYSYMPTADQWRIFASRPWHKGLPRRLRNGLPAANGQHVFFAAGGFWAITHEAIVKADIPDLGTGLTHNGGDWQIGEQLYQAGFRLAVWNQKKQFVRTSSVPRRGVTMPLVGQTVAVPPRTGVVSATRVAGTVRPTQPRMMNVPKLRVIKP